MNRSDNAIMSRVFASHRPYSAGERRADAIVHATGIAAGLIGAAVLLTHTAARHDTWLPVAIYLASLLAMLVFSAAYNMWPMSPVKWWLRRCDHSAIFLLIAGTYTPLLPFLANRNEAFWLGLVLWLGAACGIGLKFFLPGRFDRLCIVIYLALGWVGVISAHSFAQVLPGPTMTLIVIGGLLYTAGVVFHVWERLKYHNAIWHAFVASAAACHFAAIAYAYA